MPFPGPCRRCCWRAPVLFSGSSSILFPKLFFFTHDRTSRARPASSVFFSHTCFTPRLCCCWQSKALFLKCNRPTAISQVIRYRVPPTFAQSRRECDMYNIWHSNFLGWKRKKLLRLYCWERRNRQCQSTRFALNQKDWCQDCRVLDIHPLSLASIWLTGVHSNFPRRQLDLVVHKWRMRL